MKSSDWFIIGVRLLGVWLLIQCLQELIAFTELKTGMVTRQLTTSSAYTFHAMIDFCAAGLLLFGARPLAGLFDWTSLDKSDPKGQ